MPALSQTLSKILSVARRGGRSRRKRSRSAPSRLSSRATPPAVLQPAGESRNLLLGSPGASRERHAWPESRMAERRVARFLPVLHLRTLYYVLGTLFTAHGSPATDHAPPTVSSPTSCQCRAAACLPSAKSKGLPPSCFSCWVGEGLACTERSRSAPSRFFLGAGRAFLLFG